MNKAMMRQSAKKEKAIRNGRILVSISIVLCPNVRSGYG